MNEVLPGKIEEVINFLRAALEDEYPSESRSVDSACRIVADLCGRCLADVPARFKLALESINGRSLDDVTLRAWHDLLRMQLAAEFGILTAQVGTRLEDR